MGDPKADDLDVTGRLAAYISQSGTTPLRPEVVEKAKHHILDTLAAIAFGSSLKAGKLAVRFVQCQGGYEEAQVIGSPIKTTVVNAALANGMMGHAAEMDDFQPASLTHAGCAVVPAALAVAEKEGADGMRFLKGVVAGYDLCCRFPYAVGLDTFEKIGLASHSVSGTFGATAAALSIMGLKETAVRYALSYAVQQASGSLNWLRDEEHVEKAFVYGGMPARNGVTAAVFAGLGFTGVKDPFVGRPNYLYFFTRDPSSPRLLIEDLGSRFEIMNNTIKKYPVGGPIQAPLDGLLALLEKEKFAAEQVQEIRVSLSRESLYVIRQREMPNINLQYILAAALLEGKLTYETALSRKRMNDPYIRELMERIRLVHDPLLDDPRRKREAMIEVTGRKGERWSIRVTAVRGSPQKPMTRSEVSDKAVDLIGPVLGRDRAEALVRRIWGLELVEDMRELRPLLEKKT